MAIAILYREELREMDFGPGHPFRGDRFEIFPRFLRDRLAEDDNYRIMAAQPATEEDLLLICRRDYVEFTREYYKAANLGLSLPGEFHRYHSMDNMPVGKPGKVEEAVRISIGQSRLACDLVQEGKFKKAVLPVFKELYQSVKSGKETARVLRTCGRPDYAQRLAKELDAMGSSEMWAAGREVRKLRPSGKKITGTRGTAGRTMG